MEIKIGETFKVEGVKLQCLSNDLLNGCSSCYFFNNDLPCDKYPCSRSERGDGNNVFFKRIKD